MIVTWGGVLVKPSVIRSQALAEYRQALEVCAAPSVVQDALRDLELIRAAGVEGLEPVFESLESIREVQHDDPRDP